MSGGVRRRRSGATAAMADRFVGYWVGLVECDATESLANDRNARMNFLRVLPLLVVLLISALPQSLLAHGSMADPLSRSYGVFVGNPETPQNPAHAAAIAAAGTQAFYDWHEVSGLFPARDYRARIPDGQLPGVGRVEVCRTQSGPGGLAEDGSRPRPLRLHLLRGDSARPLDVRTLPDQARIRSGNTHQVVGPRATP